VDAILSIMGDFSTSPVWLPKGTLW
jgi:hypothetical protein